MIPELRKIAKEIAKEDFKGFISISSESGIYEIKIITGIIIGIVESTFRKSLFI